MKRSIVVLALITAFVLAFSAVAQGTFRGWSPIRNANELAAFCPETNPSGGRLSHFIGMDEARIEMQRNNAPAALQNSAHGGYVTTTTLCAVCHSAHRGAANMEDRVVGQWVRNPILNPGWTPGPGQTEANRPLVWVDETHPDPAARALVTAPAAAEGNAAGSTGNFTSVNSANARNQFFLTAGSTTCESCHVNSGAQASRLLVEWGGPSPGYTGGGPHGSPARGCTMCHNAGIHGLTNSRFNVFNVYMLGNTRGAIRGVQPNPSETRDEQLIREINEGRILRAGMLDIPAASVLPGGTFEDREDDLRAPAGTGNAIWWYNGARGLGPIGTTPPAFGAGVTAGGTQFGAARSLATAYTCGESGCHTATAMFNLNWGLGVERVDFQRNGATAGFQTTGMTAIGTSEVTGHIMPSLRTTGGSNQACGPCHGGNPAGFPTASTVAGARDNSRMAFGCDQCHDLVGIATNSTAWPHGNRNIMVYEWIDGVQTRTWLDAGGTQPGAPLGPADRVINGSANLWMYAGNIARAYGLETAGGTAVSTANNSGMGTFQVFRGPNSANPSFADQNWTVITGAGSGRYGLATTGTGLIDGACLKCHVALDSASHYRGGTTRVSIAADALRHAWINGGSWDADGTWSGGVNDGTGGLDPAWDGQPQNGANRLFLYR